MSHEGPACDHSGFERIGDGSESVFESSADESSVDRVTAAGRKISGSADFVVGLVWLAQLHIMIVVAAFAIVAPGSRLVSRDTELLVAEEDGDDDAGQGKKNS
jgi:hypothetical protein